MFKNINLLDTHACPRQIFCSLKLTGIFCSMFDLWLTEFPGAEPADMED